MTAPAEVSRVPVTPIRAEQIGWDCFVVVYSNGTRQQCSRDTFYAVNDRVSGGAK